MDSVDVLLMEEYHVFLYGLSQIVRTMPQIEGVVIALDVKEALLWINAKKFAVYVLDADFAQDRNVHIIKVLRKKHPDALILVHVRHDRMWSLNYLISLKVNAIISKRSSPEVFKEALADVLNGKSFYCTLVNQFIRSIRTKRKHYEALTDREREILQSIAKGLSSVQIASLLHISENTVETHRKQLMAKFQAKNAIEMTMKAVSSGIIYPD